VLICQKILEKIEVAQKNKKEKRKNCMGFYLVAHQTTHRRLLAAQRGRS
jgi:hypothetical protein